MPRHGIGIDISTLAGSEGVVTTINDFFFESFSAGQMHPILTTSRTNLIPYSHDFSQSDWSKAEVKLETSSITDPSGGTGSYKLTTESNSNQSYIQDTLTTEVGKYYTFSVYAQKAEYDYIALVGLNPLTIHYINLANGTTSSSGGITPIVEDAGNGWFRCSITLVADTTSKFFGIYLAGDNGNISQGGAADDNGVYIYGAQVEQDSRVSALIKTSGSTVTVATTLNDTSEVWDFDGTDIMIAEDPEDEGFWEESYPDGASLPELVLNGDYEELGSELVTNGDFASGGSNWGLYQTGSSTVTFPDVASINIDGSNNNVGLFQENVFTNAKTYKIVLTMKATANFIAEILESQGASTVNAIGNVSLTTSYQEFTFYYQGTGTNDLFIHRLSGETAGQNQQILIKNVLVKQVDPNNRWTLGTGWSIEGGKAVATSCTNENLVGALSILIGNAYEVTFTVSDYSGSGTVKPMLGVVGAVSGATVNADGTYTQILVADANQSVIAFRAGGTAFNGKIDNVSIKEYAIQPLDI